jgi:uncharacterized protein
MEFDWDDAKAASNELKHRLSFERAQECFTNLATEFVDARKNYAETRINRFGRLNDGTPVCITYTVRPGPLTRIISARAAKREEREIIP